MGSVPSHRVIPALNETAANRRNSRIAEDHRLDTTFVEPTPERERTNGCSTFTALARGEFRSFRE